MKKENKIGKLSLTTGTTGKIVGAVSGGCANALWDKYVQPILPESIQEYPDYVKIAVGIGLPMLIKHNDLVSSIGDAMVAIGTSKVVSSFLSDEEDQTVTGVADPGRYAVGNGGLSLPAGAPYPTYARAVRIQGKTPAQSAVGKSKRRILG